MGRVNKKYRGKKNYKNWSYQSTRGVQGGKEKRGGEKEKE